MPFEQPKIEPQEGKEKVEGETSKPFNIITYPPSKGNPKITELIKEYSRLKYGRDRAKVEEDLYKRLQL